MPENEPVIWWFTAEIFSNQMSSSNLLRSSILESWSPWPEGSLWLDMLVCGSFSQIMLFFPVFLKEKPCQAFHQRTAMRIHHEGALLFILLDCWVTHYSRTLWLKLKSQAASQDSKPESYLWRSLSPNKHALSVGIQNPNPNSSFSRLSQTRKLLKHLWGHEYRQSGKVAVSLMTNHSIFISFFR